MEFTIKNECNAIADTGDYNYQMCVTNGDIKLYNYDENNEDKIESLVKTLNTFEKAISVLKYCSVYISCDNQEYASTKELSEMIGNVLSMHQ